MGKNPEPKITLKDNWWPRFLDVCHFVMSSISPENYPVSSKTNVLAIYDFTGISRASFGHARESNQFTRKTFLSIARKLRCDDHTELIEILNGARWEYVDEKLQKALGDAGETGSQEQELAPEAWRQTNPYKGLEAFNGNDSKYLFGRNTEIKNIVSSIETKPNCIHIVVCSPESGPLFELVPASVTCSPSLGHPVGGFSGFQVLDG